MTTLGSGTQPTAGDQPDQHGKRVVVRKGDTLIDILLRAGIGRAEAHEAVTSLEALYDPRRLRVGQYLRLELEGTAAAGARLTGLWMNLDFRHDLHLSRAPGSGFDVSKTRRALTRETLAMTSVIDRSLYVAGRRASVHDDAIMQLIRLFSWDIDFQHDVKAGDSFQIVYDILTTPDGNESRVDRLRYAGLEFQGRSLAAYRFEHADGRVDYYDAEGRSVRKWLMRTPIDGARLSSGFGKRRHPILGYTRMHKGVDFAAPKGTPVYAAGDGSILRARRNGSYGNYVRIRHNEDYETAYAHLDGFAPGIRSGARVTQGDIIGYVGSTGRSTGPHLHYEVIEEGRQINPMQVKQQIATRLEGAEMRAFQALIGSVDTRLREARERKLAQNAP